MLRTRYLLIGALLAAWLLAGCKTAVETQKKSPAEIVGTLQVTFDGQTCAVQGPDSVSAGKVVVQFNNNSLESTSVGFFRLTDGKTFQDVMDLIGEGGSEVKVPAWIKGPVNPDVAPGGFWEDDFPVVAGGTYAVVCLQTILNHAWAGAGLSVAP
jgi:hypothetical protein